MAPFLTVLLGSEQIASGSFSWHRQGCPGGFAEERGHCWGCSVPKPSDGPAEARQAAVVSFVLSVWLAA